MSSRILFVLALFVGFARPAGAYEPDYSDIGPRTTGWMEDGVAVTEGVIRVRRRHENDMDFGKYNPFYWEGRRARFRLEDHSSAEERKLEFTLYTEWPQDSTRDRGSDLSLIYIGDPLAHETERSKFALNTRMEPKPGTNRTVFTKTIEAGAFDAFPEQMAEGALLVFEFRFFNDEEHGPWARQKERNAHNLSAYYSEFFRVRLGEPGLHIDDPDVPNAPPSRSRYTGGWTTTVTTRVEPWTALQQQATNLSNDNSQAFLTGRAWFHTDFQSGEHIGDEHDDKPSVFFDEMVEARRGHAGQQFNARSCNECHPRNGGAHLPEVGELVHTTVMRVPDSDVRGPQIQTMGDEAEAEVRLDRYVTHVVRLDDGTEVELSRPIFSVDGRTEIPISPRRPPSLVGLGLLDSVHPEEIVKLAEAGGTVGEIQRYKGGFNVGRFGWKAEARSLDYQIREALREDMAVQKLPEHEDFSALRAYVELLGVPPRARPEAPEVLRGQDIFASIGCADCHLPTLKTSVKAPLFGEITAELANQTIHPYTDLLLHDMGPGLSDSTGEPNAALWRTAPLWGLKNTRDAVDDHRDRFPPGNTEVTYEMTQAAARENPVELLHDGRARSLAEAILWHGGEAEESVQKYKALSAEERADLEAFVWDL